MDRFLEKIYNHWNNDDGTNFITLIDTKIINLSYSDLLNESLKYISIFQENNIPKCANVLLVIRNPLQIFMLVLCSLITQRRPIVFAHPSPKIKYSDYSNSLIPVINHAAPDIVLASGQDASYLSVMLNIPVKEIDINYNIPNNASDCLAAEACNPLFIQYSSGTTGAKKGVAISSLSLCSQIEKYAKAINLQANDVIISWLPFYHDMGYITSLMLPLFTKCKVILLSPFDWVAKPSLLLHSITKFKGTHIWLPNFAYIFMAKAIQDHELINLNLSSVKCLTNCSEPISNYAHDIFFNRFKKYGLKRSSLSTCYAMAETTFAITQSDLNKSPVNIFVNKNSIINGQKVQNGNHIIVSSGRPIEDTLVKIISDDGSKLPENNVGIIAVRSPSVMTEYYKNINETNKCFDKDNYLITGDIGFIQNGELYVTGRKKDVIIVNGRNIFPQDIEEIVSSINHVKSGRVVAFGIYDEDRGSESLVILAETIEKDSDIRQQLKKTIANKIQTLFEVHLYDVIVLDHMSLIKSTSGKISRKANFKAYKDNSFFQNEQEKCIKFKDDLEQKIWELVCRKTKYKDLNTNDSLLSSGLIDSLGLTNLIIAIEDLIGRKLPTPDSIGYKWFDSVSDIHKLVQSKQTSHREKFIAVTERDIKVTYFDKTDKNFNGYITGSSRAYMLPPDAAKSCNMKLFNFSFAGIRAEEVFCLHRFFIDQNKHKPQCVFIGIDPELFTSALPIDIRFQACSQLFDYLDVEDKTGKGDIMVEDNPKNEDRAFMERLRLRYSSWQPAIQFSRQDGFLINRLRHEANYNKIFKLDLNNIDLAHLEMLGIKMLRSGLSKKRINYFERFLKNMSEQKGHVIAFINPYSEKVLKKAVNYQQSQNIVIEYLNSLKYKNFTFLNTQTPSVFDGNDLDFMDDRHMGWINGKLLMNFLLKHFDNRIYKNKSKTADIKGPDFIIIGAMKCGTTTLHECLGNHHQIFMTKIKETQFFAKHHYKGYDYYHSFFKDADSFLLRGETSPQYSSPFYKQIPEFIHKYNPKIKLIYLVRNPIKRIRSHCAHYLSDKDLNSNSINQELLQIWIDRSKYWDILESYLKYFSDKQIKVIAFEDLINNPFETVSQILQFLEAPLIKSENFWLPWNNKTPKARKIIIPKNIENIIRKEVKESSIKILNYIGKPSSFWNF